MSEVRLIAVDGPAASGKGTLARRIARHFGFAYLDTGLLYRAVGNAVIAKGNDFSTPDAAIAAAEKLTPESLENPDLRSEAAGEAASRAAAIPEVRDALVTFQKDFAASPPDGKPGAVLDGRDIGTVICPDADRKIFVDADISVRAERRVKELRERDVDAIHSRVLQNMRERDARDRSRSVAPLAPAKDAFVLDTTSLDADAAFAAALEYISLQDKSDA